MTDCSLSKSCSGSQPFYVSRNNPRFPYAREGYLPAQCYCSEYQPPLLKGEAQQYHHANEYEQLRAELTFLRNKVAELQTKRKPRGEY